MLRIKTGYLLYAQKYKDMGYRCFGIVNSEPYWSWCYNIKELSPQTELLQKYAWGMLTEIEFYRLYLDYLNSLDMGKILYSIDKKSRGTKGAVLLSPENSYDFKHREILKGYLRKHYNINLEELEIAS